MSVLADALWERSKKLEKAGCLRRTNVRGGGEEGGWIKDGMEPCLTNRLVK